MKLHSVKIECNAFDTRMSNEEVLSWLRQNVSKLNNFTHQIRSI